MMFLAPCAPGNPRLRCSDAVACAVLSAFNSKKLRWGQRTLQCNYGRRRYLPLCSVASHPLQDLNRRIGSGEPPLPKTIAKQKRGEISPSGIGFSRAELLLRLFEGDSGSGAECG